MKKNPRNTVLGPPSRSDVPILQVILSESFQVFTCLFCSAEQIGPRQVPNEMQNVDEIIGNRFTF